MMRSIKEQLIKFFGFISLRACSLSSENQWPVDKQSLNLSFFSVSEKYLRTLNREFKSVLLKLNNDSINELEEREN